MLREREEILSKLDPLVREWFLKRFKYFTPPQQSSILNILDEKSVLVASPTGSGKTLSAFLAIISNLVTLARSNRLEDKVYCIYISPLRSLNNDIAKNLKMPLEELAEMDDAVRNIRIGIRTGDTKQQERAKMLRKPPHILITTPESIAIILSAPRFRELLRDVRWVIVDEIHELCSSKRGVHLSLSLERLENLCNRKITRIGLSATIHPLDEVARYLVGYDNDKERECAIIDKRFVKPMRLQTITPVSDLVHTSAEIINKKMYELLKSIIEKSNTTLIFTNTRSGTERVVYHLAKMNVVDIDQLAAHHSSLSRENRLEVEDKLKNGMMRAVVTSTSLELGIDIGSIDVVAQIGSPKSIARCLQRVGRSGHSLDKESRGCLIALERDDLMEDIVICINAMKGRIDRVHIPKRALDVLAQHIVGMATEQVWKVKDAYNLIRRSYCYRDLSIEELRRVIKYLSGGYGLDTHKVYGKIWYDEEKDEFGKKGYMARVIYSTNIGTIPDEVAVKVYCNNRWIGNIEEEFLERLSKGDIFVLGGKTYQFISTKGFRANVKDAEGQKPTIPNWFSEMLPLSFDLGEAIGKLRGDIFNMLKENYKISEIVKLLKSEAYLDTKGAKALISYIKAEYDFLKMLNVNDYPDNKSILIENYIDNEGKQNIIFHGVFGRRVNDALARAYANVAKRISRKNVIINVSDHAFMLTLTKGVRVDINAILEGVDASNIRELLLDAIKYTEMVKRRFRHCAARSLMILRNYKGHEVTVARQQTNAEVLIRLCEKLDRFPVLEETYREVMEDLMDLNTAIKILEDVEEHRRRFIILKEFDLPSPFSHDLIVSGYSDIVLMHDRKELLELLHDMVIARIRDDQDR